ncbi:protease modulator HflC [candidate division KSB1 bacterium]|nr:protease modulator HflC [candidate division KSB1 bacterium]
MKTQQFAGLFIAIVILVIISIFSGIFFVVDETEQVVITKFGKPVRTITTAGLKMKIPVIHQVNKFDKRILEWDGIPTEISAKDKVFIEIDTYARWRIVEPLKFFRSVRSESGAQARLDNIIDAAARDYITSNVLIEVVRSSNRKMDVIETELETSTSGVDSIYTGRDKIAKGILKAASDKVSEYGIELIDVRIKRMNYIESVRNKVFERMIAERLRIAEKYRSEGQGKRAEIEGEMEKELQKITSEAYKQAQEIEGKADAEAIKIYASAYEQDPEFYSFTRTLETYKNTVDEKTWLLLTTDNEFLKYINSTEGK